MMMKKMRKVKVKMKKIITKRRKKREQQPYQSQKLNPVNIIKTT
jgi:hypothetical protein